jgi:N-acetylmuramoyl-L-alanine amidase
MRIRWAGLLAMMALAAAMLQARDRAAAREAFRQATSYYTWLQERPESQRTKGRYLQGITLFRKVIDADPTYGAADDALYHIALLYDQLAERFGADLHRKRAIYYYEFVAREYPTTRHRDPALRRAAELKSGQAASRTKVEPVQPAPSRQAADRSPPAPRQNDGDLATLSEVRYWSNEDYTRVVLQLDREVQFHKEVLSGPDRIYFDLEGTRVDPSMVNHVYEVNGLFIRQIRLAENRPNVTRVVLDFDRINQHTVFALYDPFRIVIDTRGEPRTEVASAAAPAETGAAPTADPGTPEPAVGPESGDIVAASPTIQGSWTLTRALGLKVGRVVIDPGHGGKDTGTVGRGGLKEKDLVLAVSLKLRDLLEQRLGVEVVLTRDDDRFIPLEERTAIANQKGADLFISIHANASRNRKAFGIETYVLDFATSDAEIEVASRENAGSQKNIRELEDLLRKIARVDYNRESRDLAHTVQKELVAGLSTDSREQRDRGIKQAPFIVLIGSNMPSILTEIGFISNPADEKLLMTAAGQERVAEALYRGIEAYFRSLGIVPTLQQAASSGR